MKIILLNNMSMFYKLSFATGLIFFDIAKSIPIALCPALCQLPDWPSIILHPCSTLERQNVNIQRLLNPCQP